MKCCQPKKERKHDYDARNLSEKLQFYHIKSKNTERKHLTDPSEDIRHYPDSLKSASSFLLFNTAENPYSKFNFVNSLDNKNRVSAPANDALPKTLDEAPDSMVNTNHEEDDLENYFYNPNMGDMPELDLPDNLDLDNIAQDLSYMHDLGPGIAPSIFNNNNSSDDFFSSPIPTQPKKEEPSEVPSISSMDAPPPPPAPSAPPPPPPPTAPPAAPPPPSAPAPPPPPPPVVDDEETDQPEVEKDDEADNPPPSGDRNSLLDSIRNAGGIKSLKSVKERKMEEKKAKEEVSSSSASGGGVDLLSDLAGKLALRRKGMSGNKPAESSSSRNAPMSMMDRMSAMIPPPPNAGEESDSDRRSDDSDW